jgi:M6 family metalloprotease-like protein
MMVAVAVLLAAATGLRAAPFAKTISFTQPDGTPIELWGQGDEFYANFETLDGYTVVFDHALKAYCFAELAADESQLISTGVQVHQGNPAALGLSQHLRLGREAIRRQVQERYARWDAGMQISERWAQRKAAWQQAEAEGESRPPGTTTTGNKLGLCLLIDFDDDPATVPQAQIVDFCNGDNYTGYGNNGSVKKYYQDNSGGLLTYSNVVTIYIRIPNSLHPKSYYNDTSKDCGAQGNLLIRDAIAVMKSLPNYTTEILPAFDALTVNAANQVLACNVFYAGGNGGVWTYGLWPHSWSLYDVGAQELSAGGKKVWFYQISNIGSSLELGTFCHENGHMLCGYPDIYDYDYDSVGGAGAFCLMNSGGHGINPAQICAYLKRASGWATTTELTSTSAALAIVSASGTNFNHFYRYQKPGVSTEYFLVECRYKTNRDVNLFASGVAIWHVDELGDHNNQSLVPNSTHANYEVTLVQADNQWHFERNINSGDNYDLYHSGNTSAGYNNTFTDISSPNAHWWNGVSSGVNFHDFTARGNNMSFVVGDVMPVVLTQPTNQTIKPGNTARFVVTASGAAPLRYQWLANGFSLTNGGRFSGATNATLTISNTLMADSGAYRVIITNLLGSATSSVATLIVTDYPPVITLQPAGQTVGVSGTAVFSVTGSGTGPFFYQWKCDGRNLAGATAATLTLTNVAYLQIGLYSVIVSNAYGSTASSGAMLTVLPVISRDYHFTSPITIADFSAASPYPATCTVSGYPGVVSEVAVTLNQINHGWPDDLDILLVGPQGQSAMLMSDAGGAHALTNVTLVFRDAAAAALLDGAQITAGTWRPSDFESGDTLPSPAPAGPYGTALSVFAGVNPAGTWKLFVYDDTEGDAGNIAGGWSLRLSQPTSPVLLPLVVVGEQVQLRFTTVAGVQYVVEFKNALSEPAWQTLQTIAGDNALHTISDSAVPQRYYRIRCQ